jgi:hypothetical protein
MSRLPVFALTLSIALLTAAAARAADGGPAPAVAVESGDEVLVSAERLERDNEKRVVTGEGAVTIRHRELRLVADRVVYHERTKEVIADGNVVLDSGEDRLQGEHGAEPGHRIGFSARAGSFRPTISPAADRKAGTGPLLPPWRRFTTCEGTMPDWSFRATSPTSRSTSTPRLEPDPEGQAFAGALLPYAIFPVKRDRATGLLIRRWRSRAATASRCATSSLGAPATSTPRWDHYLQKDRLGPAVRCATCFAARTQGVLDAYYLHNTRTSAERWSLSTRNSQELLGINAEAEAFIRATAPSTRRRAPPRSRPGRASARPPRSTSTATGRPGTSRFRDGRASLLTGAGPR